MSARIAVLLLTGPRRSPAAPPGVDAAALVAALAEDVFTVFAELDDVAEAIAYTPENAALAAAISWPGTVLTAVPAAGAVPHALAALGAAGYTQAALVAADAPDLPALHIAKTFSALSTSSAAAAPAVGGGLVVLASRLPPRSGLTGLDLDSAVPAWLRLTPTWRRLRRAEDLDELDPGLDGWAATRALLGY